MDLSQIMKKTLNHEWKFYALAQQVQKYLSLLLKKRAKRKASCTRASRVDMRRNSDVKKVG